MTITLKKHIQLLVLIFILPINFSSAQELENIEDSKKSSIRKELDKHLSNLPTENIINFEDINYDVVLASVGNDNDKLKKFMNSMLAGYIWAESGNKTMKISHFLNAHEIVPEEPHVNSQLGWLYLYQNDIEKAKPYMLTAAKNYKKKAHRDFHNAELLAMQQKPDQAIGYYDSLRKGNYFGLKELANFKYILCLIMLDRFDEAKKEAEVYGHIDDKPYFYLIRAAMALKSGDREKGYSEILSAYNVFGEPTVNHALYSLQMFRLLPQGFSSLESRILTNRYFYVFTNIEDVTKATTKIMTDFERAASLYYVPSE